MNKDLQQDKAIRHLACNPSHTQAWDENHQSTTVAEESQKLLLNKKDEYLKELAKIAQQYPPLSRERQLALTRLVNGIMQSGKLFHPQRSQFSAAIYQEISQEAHQELLLYICQNINKYDPERGSVMTWVNFLFSRRFFPQAMREILYQQRVPQILVTDSYNVEPESEPNLPERLKEYINSDPENLLKRKRMAKCPVVNFQALAQRRISGKTWKKISAEFGVKIPTISIFYYRSIKKFSSQLQEYCMKDVI
ncbi:sigma-70 family RNA polymerase sigma factor [Brasilonema octagenarum]|uniref:sigma-70 family RNA polymerase sigma factor n=1 Tax=Brasilonema octagenarum TaxID=417105 RepID=UPI002006DDF7|nr:sigma-70 family RNA polymerase sigma factor [Brasilonema octagenarum]